MVNTAQNPKTSLPQNLISQTPQQSTEMNEMNSRERVLAAINLQPVDRIPTDIWATPEVWDKLRAHFGTAQEVWRGLHLHGIGGVRPRYIGARLACHPERTDQNSRVW